MEFVILIGRVLFGLLFIAAAMGHLTQTAGMAAYAESRGVPNAHLAVQVSGVAIFIGAVSVILGVYGDIGALILVVFLGATAATIHKFWSESEGDARVMTQTQFMKDVALAGAALVLFAVFAEAGDTLGFTLTGSAF